MRWQQYWFLAAIAVAAAAIAVRPSMAATVALEDFDGGAVNLISSSVTNLDGGGGDWFGVGNLSTWPQPTGVPFSLADDSVANVSGGGAFPADLEGTFGQARINSNDFFGLSDTREWTPAQLTASWTFDVSGYKDLQLCVDMGAVADGTTNAGFDAATSIKFTYQIDGGPVGTAFSVAPNANAAGFAYRAMDSGGLPVIGANGPLQATGDNSVTKTLADTGLASAETFLNKAPAAGTGAGLLDTFGTALSGTGSQLTVTMVAHLPFEAAALDNLVVKGEIIPEPATFALLGLGALLLANGRRKLATSAT